MSFLSLPNELLLMIASSLSSNDVCSLLRANKRLNALLTDTLRRFAALPRKLNRRGYRAITCQLHWAVWKGSHTLFGLLVESGLNPANCVPMSCCETLLHFAACGGSEAIVRDLLARGADVSATTWAGETPLHYAVHCGHEGVVRALLEHGAQVNTRLPILHCAVGRYMGESGLWAVEHPSRMPARWDARVVELLLRNGAEVDARHPTTGATALHQATRYGNLEMARILLKAGASTGVRCRFGETVFEWGLQFQAVEAMRLFQIEGVVPLLGGKYYDERRPRGSVDYWRLVGGMGTRNRLRALWKAYKEGDPMAGASNDKRLREYCRNSKRDAILANISLC